MGTLWERKYFDKEEYIKHRKKKIDEKNMM